MPVMACELNGKPGWKYGPSGKCYTYPKGDAAASGKAKQKAYLQGVAETGGKLDKDLGLSDVHVATTIGNSLAARRARYKKLAESLPEELMLREGFVSGVALSDSVAIRLDRAPVLLHAWSQLRKSATFKLIEAATVGEAPMYDLVLKKRRMREEPEEEEAEDVSFKILKADAPLRKVWGIVFEPNEVDTQGDFERPAEIEKAAHAFAERYRTKRAHLWLSHERPLADTEATLLENYIAPADFTLGGQKVKKGSWLQSWQLSPMLWGQVEKGELTGFSFGGTGVRKFVEAA